MGHATDLDLSNDVVEPGTKKFKASDTYDDGLLFDWGNDGIDLPVADMEVDEAKEAPRIDADWNEFVAEWGELPVQFQEAFMAKKEHFNKILKARVKPSQPY